MCLHPVLLEEKLLLSGDMRTTSCTDRLLPVQTEPPIGGAKTLLKELKNLAGQNAFSNSNEMTPCNHDSWQVTW